MPLMLNTIVEPVEASELLPDINLSGLITWFSSASVTTTATVESAVQRANGKELFIDCVYASSGSSAAACRVLLRRDTSRTFAGIVVLMSDNRSLGTCTCRFYTNGLRFALVGRWHAGGTCQDWIAELSPR